VNQVISSVTLGPLPLKLEHVHAMFEKKSLEGSCLVKKSESWCVELIGGGGGRDVLEAISLCLVISWKVGLEAMCPIDWLSHQRREEVLNGTWKSLSNEPLNFIVTNKIY
jgi:hypothetical protein